MVTGYSILHKELVVYCGTRLIYNRYYGVFLVLGGLCVCVNKRINNAQWKKKKPPPKDEHIKYTLSRIK